MHESKKDVQKQLKVIDRLLVLSGKDNISPGNHKKIKIGSKLISLDLINYMDMDKVTLIIEKKDNEINMLMAGRKDREVEILEDDYNKNTIKCLKVIDSEIRIRIENEKFIATDLTNERNTFYFENHQTKENAKKSDTTYLYCCEPKAKLDNLEDLDKLMNESGKKITYTKK